MGRVFKELSNDNSKNNLYFCNVLTDYYGIANQKNQTTVFFSSQLHCPNKTWGDVPEFLFLFVRVSDQLCQDDFMM